VPVVHVAELSRLLSGFSLSAVESEPRWQTVTEPWKLTAVPRAELAGVVPRRGNRGYLAKAPVD
jgi:hypothetical protein